VGTKEGDRQSRQVGLRQRKQERVLPRKEHPCLFVYGEALVCSAQYFSERFESFCAGVPAESGKGDEEEFFTPSCDPYGTIWDKEGGDEAEDKEDRPRPDEPLPGVFRELETRIPAALVIYVVCRLIDADVLVNEGLAYLDDPS